MPVVNVDPDELRELTGHPEKGDDELKADLFSLGVEFEGETADGEMKLEFEADRLDRLSVSGLARSLRYHYGDDRGVSVPETNDPDWTITVEDSVPEGRPYVTGAVVRGLDLAEGLDALIQLQEKLHATMGRERAKGAIGVHDLTMLKGGRAGDEKAITYRGVDPGSDSFVPLESDEEMTPADVLVDHPTGREYADLVGDDRVPAIYDDLGLFSFPPVINGRRTEVAADTRDLFVELTGTDQWTVDKMGTIVCYALAARGGTVEEVTVAYPDRELVRPAFDVETKRLEHDRLERTLGVTLEAERVVDLFERSGLDAAVRDGEYVVDVPPYRVDVRHPVDLVDDVGRAYGFNELVAEYPDVSTVGGRTESSRHEEAVRTALVGAGFEDLLNFHLIGEADLHERMNVAVGADVLGGERPPRIAEPYSEEYAVVRTWLLPSLLLVLEDNTHREYPQDLAEVGFTARQSATETTGVAERRHVAAVLARTDASYEDAKAHLAAVAHRFGADLTTPPTDHPSFIDGRTAAVTLDGDVAGVVGELHPEVLVDFDLELPVAAFEFRLDALR